MSEAAHLLQDAIDRNAPAAIAVQEGGLQRLCRSRLLAGDAEGVWIGLPTGQQRLFDAIAAAGESARVTIKCRELHVEFMAPVIERRQAFALNAQTRVEAVRLGRPANLAVVQRRSSYRVAVAAKSDVQFRFWRIDPTADLATTPASEAEFEVDVRDFSNAGIGGIWKRRRGEEAVLAPTQRLRIDVITPGTTVTLEALPRFIAALPEPEFRRVGLQFMLRPASLVDRTKLGLLNRITGELQRAELKRLRVAR